MKELEVTWKHTIIIWWGVTWREVVFGSLVWIAMEGGLVLVLSIFGRVEDAEVYSQFIEFIVATLVGVWVMKAVLATKFGNFRIALVPSTHEPLEKSVNENSTLRDTQCVN